MHPSSRTEPEPLVLADRLRLPSRRWWPSATAGLVALAVALGLLLPLVATAVTGRTGLPGVERRAAATFLGPAGCLVTQGCGPATTHGAQASSSAAGPAYGPGYRLAGADGGVFAFGNARYLGGMGGQGLTAPIVGLANTSDGEGYWEVSSDGGVFTYGDARYMGGMGGQRLSAPIVGIAATPDNHGYWLVSRDGGIFTYGTARYMGGMGGQRLSAPIVGIAATPDGTGYWLVSRDGGIFTYGTAHYYGGMGGQHLAYPIVGIAATSDGTGYWLVSSDGGIFTYGTARYYGGMGGHWLSSPIVGIAGSPDGNGYWLASADGGVFTYGDAGYWGAPGGFQLNRPVTAVAAGISPAFRQPHVEVGGRYGFDISWPQCSNQTLPPAHAFVVLGVTGGQAFTANPCLSSEWAWATGAAGASGVYVNLNGPDDLPSPRSASGPAGRCADGDLACAAYNYGANTVLDAFATAQHSGIAAPMWWLDVETENTWSDHTDVNALVIKGAIDELHKHRLLAGIYSTSLQYGEIAGDATFGVPVWVAGSPDLSSAASYCARGFNGGPVWMVQTMLDYDVNYLCTPDLAGQAFGVHPLPTAPAWTVQSAPAPVRATILANFRPPAPPAAAAGRPAPAARRGPVKPGSPSLKKAARAAD
ncbi:MAG TPA: hypothetical protein VFA11_00195 [Acidimicrobiales bacterium]|nr:hypothetical protein [Acidimicrobiales bacterium]